jgi:hypothetical protein
MSWYVVVAGQQPPEALEAKLTTALAAGVEASLPEELHTLVTTYHQDTPANTMTFEEWLAAHEQTDTV